MYSNLISRRTYNNGTWIVLLGIIGNMLAGCEKPAPPVNRQLDSHANPVECVAISPDGKTLVTGGWDSFSSEKAELLVWDATTRRLKVELKGHQKPVKYVAFNPEGNLLASTSYDGTVRFWNISKGKEVRKLTLNDLKPVDCLAFSPDGNILTAGAYGNLWFWDVHTGKELAKANAHRLGPHCVTFSPDGKYVASCYGNLDILKENTVKLWDADSRKLHLVIKDMDSDAQAVVFLRDSKTLAVGCEEGAVIFQRLDGEKKRRSIKTGLDYLQCLSVSPNGKLLAVRGGDDERRGVIEFYEIDSLKRAGIIKAKDLPILGLAFSPDGRTIAGCSYSEENSITIFDVPAKPEK